MINLHISSLKTYRKCKRAFWFSDENCMNLETKYVNDALFQGTVWHAMVEAYYKYMKNVDAAYQAAALQVQKFAVDEDTAEELTLLTTVVKKWFNHYLLVQDYWNKVGMMNDMNWEWRLFEGDFKIPIYNKSRAIPNVKMCGKIDGIIKDTTTGDFWIIEWKTSAQPDRLISSLDLDSQATNYLAAVQAQVKIPLKGILYVIIRKQVPDAPEQLKNGSFSKNKSLKCTAAWYVKTLKEKGLSKEQILEYKEFIESLPNDYFFQIKAVTRTQKEIDNYNKTLAIQAIEIKNLLAQGTPDVFYPSDNFDHCSYCAFRNQCLQMNRGEQPNLFNFIKRSERNEYNAE